VTAGIKHGLRRVAAACGLFDTARRLSAHWPRILMYHHFCGPGESRTGCMPADRFRQQLEYITHHYQPLRLLELGQSLAADDPLPARSVVITVDDGYVSFRRWALPLLQEFQVPATLFVVSDLPDSGRWLWTDKFEYLCNAAAGITALSGRRGHATLSALKHLAPADRDQRLEDLAQQAGIRIPADAPAPYALLSWADLEELAGSALVDIGAHSRTHALLDSIPAERAWEEISGSRQELERRLGVEVATFCYPNGLFSDYRPEHLEMVAKAGFRCATAAHFGYVTADSDRFALPRIGSDASDPSMFRKHLDGFEYLQHRLINGRCW
jgi:peptidoglycan/xylan/chitin deacetylase (PgdA/CDA1 family)